jgi:hypothetical protein
MELIKNNLKLRFTKWVKSEDHVEYQIKIISTKDDNLNVDFNQRYSSLRDLHDVLRKEANTSKFPKFPPKKYFGNTDERFLNQRMAALDHYFNQVFEDFSHLNQLKKWIDDKITKCTVKKVAKENIAKDVNINAIKKNQPIVNSNDPKLKKERNDNNSNDKNNKDNGKSIKFLLFFRRTKV